MVHLRCSPEELSLRRLYARCLLGRPELAAPKAAGARAAAASPVNEKVLQLIPRLVWLVSTALGQAERSQPALSVSPDRPRRPTPPRSRRGSMPTRSRWPPCRGARGRGCESTTRRAATSAGKQPTERPSCAASRAAAGIYAPAARRRAHSASHQWASHPRRSAPLSLSARPRSLTQQHRAPAERARPRLERRRARSL